MSERIPEQYHEQGHESRPERSENASKGPEKRHEAVEHKLNVENIKKNIEHEAVSKDEVSVADKEERSAQHRPAYVNKELKKLTYKRTVSRIQHRLKTPDKVLSKVIHQPAVDALSRAGEKTIGRPISMLSGAVFAFLGTSFALYMSKHYGFKYNFLLFAILFTGGFALGIILELLLAVFRRSSAKR